MDGKTRRQIALLLLGIFLGYNFFQFYRIYTEYSELVGSDLITRRYYRYSNEMIVKKVDDLEVHFNVISGYEYNYRYYALRSCFFNVSLVNPTEEIRWINLQEDYYKIEIYSEDTILYSFNGELDNRVESETVFLAPKGMHNLFFFWGGSYENTWGRFARGFPTGVYEVKCVFHLGDEDVILEGITFESYTKIGPSSVPL